MDSKMTAPADTDALVALHDAAWDAIICDEELREFRKKCSIHEIRQVVRACLYPVEKQMTYYVCVKCFHRESYCICSGYQNTANDERHPLPKE